MRHNDACQRGWRGGGEEGGEEGGEAVITNDILKFKEVMEI